LHPRTERVGPILTKGLDKRGDANRLPVFRDSRGHGGKKKTSPFVWKGRNRRKTPMLKHWRKSPTLRLALGELPSNRLDDQAGGKAGGPYKLLGDINHLLGRESAGVGLAFVKRNCTQNGKNRAWGKGAVCEKRK